MLLPQYTKNSAERREGWREEGGEEGLLLPLPFPPAFAPGLPAFVLLLVFVFLTRGEEGGRMRVA